MEKEVSYYSGLLTGFISNTISAERVTELLTFIEEEPDAYNNIIESTEIQTLLERQAYNNAINVSQVVSMRMKERLMATINVSHQMGRVKALWMRIAAAAAVVLFISFGAYFIFRPKETKDIVQTQQRKNDVTAPAASKARITLSNGQTILLDSMRSGTLATQGNVKVLKTSDGQIIYNESSKVSPKGGDLEGAAYNTLSNPRGSKTISLTLSDGSQVWLNAASSLKYPTAFTGNERKVEVTGEAYFEVAHNPKIPFKVTKDALEITVLGTHFNVNTYGDETDIKITLLEGSVKVADANSFSLLKPGQQAVVASAGQIKIVTADIDEVMAWKNDLFHFESADIQTILRQFARWYDVEVVYEGTPNNKKFFGIVSRKSTLTEVLQLLKANDIKFRIDGKKLIVTSG